MTKHLHSETGGAPFLQDISYTYNERGWLGTINDPTMAPSANKLFAMRLNYNLPQYGALAQYNGNIAEQDYNTGASLRQHVTYGYDRLNRLTNGISTNSNNEQGISYDLNGNIMALQRSGYANDNLSYTYMNGNQSNQLASIVDAAGTNSGLGNGTTTFAPPDANGNTTSITYGDPAKNKSFTYNLLNLPQTVTVSNGTVTYTYDATGQKLRKVAVINGVTTATDYIGGIQYKNNGSTIDFIQTEEGKAANTGSGYDYVYYLGDNLGNTRVTFDKSATLQTDNYYPFGLEISGTQSGSKNEYLYNKKELQEELGQYDYGARFYDPVIGRWNVIDPLAETDRRWSPYTYGFDNSIRFEDPDGMWPDGDDGCCGVVGAFVGGFVSDIKEAVTGTIHAVTHPVETFKAIDRYNPTTVSGKINAAIDGSMAASAVKNKWDKGDANVKAGMLGAATGEVVQLFGGEAAEAGKAGKLAEIDKLAEVDKIAEVTKTDAIHVTQDGVAIPKGEKYQIPNHYVENPHRQGNYGTMENGKFKEKLRIDPATKPGQKGPNVSHYHKNGKSTHYVPDGKDPGFK